MATLESSSRHWLRAELLTGYVCILVCAVRCFDDPVPNSDIQDGRIKVGDQIISVDNITLEGCTQDE